MYWGYVLSNYRYENGNKRHTETGVANLGGFSQRDDKAMSDEMCHAMSRMLFQRHKRKEKENSNNISM